MFNKYQGTDPFATTKKSKTKGLGIALVKTTIQSTTDGVNFVTEKAAPPFKRVKDNFNRAWEANKEQEDES